MIIPNKKPFIKGFLMALVFVAVLARRLGRTALVPEKDPRLVESLAFENY